MLKRRRALGRPALVAHRPQAPAQYFGPVQFDNLSRDVQPIEPKHRQLTQGVYLQKLRPPVRDLRIQARTHCTRSSNPHWMQWPDNRHAERSLRRTRSALSQLIECHSVHDNLNRFLANDIPTIRTGKKHRRSAAQDALGCVPKGHNSDHQSGMRLCALVTRAACCRERTERNNATP